MYLYFYLCLKYLCSIRKHLLFSDLLRQENEMHHSYEAFSELNCHLFVCCAAKNILLIKLSMSCVLRCTSFVHVLKYFHFLFNLVSILISIELLFYLWLDLASLTLLLLKSTNFRGKNRIKSCVII